MIDTIIFDMDGVIVDSEPIHLSMTKELLKQFNIEISDQELHAFVGTSSRNMWGCFKEKFDLPISIEELLEQDKSKYFKYLREHNVMPIPGVVSLIEDIHKASCPMILASSASAENIDIVLSKFGIAHYFKFRISGANLKHSKPHPEIFLTSASITNTKPKNCLVIEDSENGVKAAKSAGMKCIGFKNHNSGGQDLSQADIVIESFENIDIKWIERYFDNDEI